MPHLTIAKRGFTCKFDLADIVNAILFKLKAGLQWEFLSIEYLFDGEKTSYKTVFYHYRKWCKRGVWQSTFATIVRKHKHILDLSVSHIDGSQLKDCGLKVDALFNIADAVFDAKSFRMALASMESLRMYAQILVEAAIRKIIEENMTEYFKATFTMDQK